MGWWTPLSGPDAGRLVWRDSAPDAERPAPATPEALGAPSALVGGELDDGMARWRRGRDGAAKAVKDESDRRGWGFTLDQCRARVASASAAVARRGGG